MIENDLTYDILREMFNISAGKAANTLSEITNKKILLNVPSIKVLNLEDKDINATESFVGIPEGALMVSSINFGDKITGNANLIFPANKMKKFLSLCMGEETIDVEEDLNFTDIDFDIVREVGNIILNSIVGEIGNFLNTSMHYKLPRVEVFDKMDFTKEVKDKKDLCIIVLYITFIIDGTEIEGAVVIGLTLNSLNELMKLIKEVEDDLYE